MATNEQILLGELYLWIERRAEFLRKKNAGDITRQDELSPATNANHPKATGNVDDTPLPEMEQLK